MIGKNEQGHGKSNPNPRMKTHVGLGNHKQHFTNHEAAKNQAPQATKVAHTGQPPKK